MSDIPELTRRIARNNFQAGFYAGVALAAIVGGALLLLFLIFA